MEYPAGWTCEVVVVRLEAYLLGTLLWADALALAEHIEACVSCAQLLVLTEEQSPRPGHGGA